MESEWWVLLLNRPKVTHYEADTCTNDPCEWKARALGSKHFIAVALCDVSENGFLAGRSQADKSLTGCTEAQFKINVGLFET